MRYTVRSFRNDDASALHALTQAAIRTLGPERYSQDQIDAWAARHSVAHRFLERVRAGHTIFIAVNPSDEPAAFSLIEPDGHLDQLYCHPGHSRRGLAGLVLQAAENHARSVGIGKLYTEASELARPVFESCGYTVTRRRDFTIYHNRRSVPIHNYAMEKSLS